MKNKNLITIVLLFISSLAMAQTNQCEQYKTALASGNANALASYFNSTIELTLNGSEGAYSKVQAEQLLKDFFAKNPAASFEYSHKGPSSSGNSYAIGTYKSSNNSVFRVTIYTKQVDNKNFIQQMKFEK